MRENILPEPFISLLLAWHVHNKYKSHDKSVWMREYICSLYHILFHLCTPFSLSSPSQLPPKHSTSTQHKPGLLAKGVMKSKVLHTWKGRTRTDYTCILIFLCLLHVRMERWVGEWESIYLHFGLYFVFYFLCFL